MIILPKNKYIIAMTISALIGIAVVILSAVWLNKIETITMSEVVVAADKLEPGVKLTTQKLMLKSWPKDSIPIGAVMRSDQLVNRTPKMEIAKGEVVLERMLAPLSNSGSMAVQIAPGKRAFTMSVNEAAGVAGFAMPGNFVDVILNSKDQNSQELSKIILQKILILAVAQDRISDDSKPKVVNAITIEVTPVEAETLDLARSIGSLSLVLRHQHDVADGESLGITRKDLVSNSLKGNGNGNGKKEPKHYAIEVIRGI
jgi:pilus assembly protein CpaB